MSNTFLHCKDAECQYAHNCIRFLDKAQDERLNKNSFRRVNMFGDVYKYCEMYWPKIEPKQTRFIGRRYY